MKKLILAMFVISLLSGCVAYEEQQELVDEYYQLSQEICEMRELRLAPFITCGEKITDWAYYPIYTNDLYALTDTESIHGSFFLASGYVNESLVYRFMIKRDGALLFDEIQATNAIIFEGDGVPRVTRWDYYSPKQGYSKDSVYIFYLPKGTVLNSIDTLDMK